MMTKHINNLSRILLLAVMVMVQLTVSAKDEYHLGGVVRDATTLEPLPYASVTVEDYAIGALTNEKGIFDMTVPNAARILIVNCLGYNRRTIEIHKNQVNLYDIMLTPSETELKEVVVKRQKYSKKNNPAVEFMHRLKECGPLTDPKRNPYYNYQKHELITLAINDFNPNEGSWLLKKFPFLNEHVDTSEVSGKPILNVLVKERASDVHYRKDPESTKEVVTASRQQGIDEIADKTSMQSFFNDVLGEIDLYANDINLLQNRFVSPLSRIAPDFYKFYLTDTVEVGDERCIVLSFYPHNTASFGFNGQIFVPVNDSTMFVKKVTMRTPRNINLNFVDDMVISQEFERAPDGSRLKVRDDLIFEASVAGKGSGFYVRRNIAYDNHDFKKPDDLGVFDRLAKEIVEPDAENRDELYWDAVRILSVTDNEKRVNTLMDNLRSVPVFYYTEKFLKIMFTGYVQTGKDSKWDYGPVNTTISSGPVDGLRLRVGGMTTANLSKRWFSRGYVAYGMKDHKWKYSAELEYSMHDKKYHSREFPVHSLRLTSLYDIDQLGQEYLFTSKDNIFVSLKRMEDFNVTYQWLNKLEYIMELENNFSLTARLQSDRQYATRWLPFVDGYGTSYRDFLENSFTLQLRYAPGEKFYQAKTFRIPINLDAPVFMISHTIAPKGWLGSKYMVNKTEVSLQKRLWFSAFGFTDIILKGGHVWSKSPFTSLLIPNANLSYTIQPESYALLNAMEFVNDSYASIDVTYWLNGALFNLIPGVKKLKLREAVGFKGLWGHLSEKNDPQRNPELLRLPAGANVTRMSDRPYMELSAGLDNLFKCLRVDYVWRLSYLDVPYPIDRRGLRVAVHVTF